MRPGVKRPTCAGNRVLMDNLTVSDVSRVSAIAPLYVQMYPQKPMLSSVSIRNPDRLMAHQMTIIDSKPVTVHDQIEEILNSMTHGLGALFSIVGTVVLIVAAGQLGDMWKILSFSIFGATLILLYLASAFYHGSRQPRLKAALKTLDHCAIFLLIAGTYTPFLLVNMRGTTGWILFAIIWSLAVTGVILKLVFGHRFRLVRVGIYLAMGWLIVFASADLMNSLSEMALQLTIAGGIIYTVGVVFYLMDRIPYMHAIWHLFVIGGSACHFSAVYVGVLPYSV